MLDLVYYLSSISVVYILITYPMSWDLYYNRPVYEVENYGNFSVLVSVNGTAEDCFRLMSEADATDRLKFTNGISTELVLVLSGVDWVLIFVGGIASTVLWYRSRHTPTAGLIRKHSILEAMGLVSLLVFSPLCYPAIVDDYSQCLDDNILMKYNIYTAIFAVLALAIAMIGAYVGLYYLDWSGGIFGMICGVVAVLMVGIMLVISVWVTYNTNSFLSLSIIVGETAVAVYTIYEDYIHTYTEEIKKPDEVST